MAGAVPLLQHLRDQRAADHSPLHGPDEEVADGAVGQPRLLVRLQPLLLLLGEAGQLADCLTDERGHVAEDVAGVLTLDRHLAGEAEVVADEDTAAHAQTGGEALDVAVPQAGHDAVVVAAAAGAPERAGRLHLQQAEVLLSLPAEGVGLMDHFDASFLERGTHLIHHLDVRDGEVGVGRGRGERVADCVHRALAGTGVKREIRKFHLVAPCRVNVRLCKVERSSIASSLSPVKGKVRNRM